MDAHVSKALEARADLTQQVKHLLTTGGDKARLAAIARSLERAQTIVWKEKAHKAMSEFWSDPDNLEQCGGQWWGTPEMAQYGLNIPNRRIRIIREMLYESQLHWFGTSDNGSLTGVQVPYGLLPKAANEFLAQLEEGKKYSAAKIREARDSISQQIQRIVSTRNRHEMIAPVVGIAIYPYDGGQNLSFIVKVAVASGKEQPQALEDYRYAVAEHHVRLDTEWCTDPLAAAMLYYHYQRHHFIDQPYTGAEQHRTYKKGDKKQNPLSRSKDERVYVLHLRKRDEFLRIHGSDRNELGGKKWCLEYESHTAPHSRTYHRGTADEFTIWIDTFTRGPIGVLREKVMKVTR